MSLHSASTCRAVLVAATVLAAACVRPVASRNEMSVPGPVPTAGMAPAELLLDAEMSVEGCAQRNGDEGFARVKVRDSYEAGAPSELEYELAIENKERRPLNEAVLALSGVGPNAREVLLVLWNGECRPNRASECEGSLRFPVAYRPRKSRPHYVSDEGRYRCASRIRPALSLGVEIFATKAPTAGHVKKRRALHGAFGPLNAVLLLTCPAVNACETWPGADN